MKNLKKLLLIVVMLVAVVGCSSKPMDDSAKVASLSKGGVTKEALYTALKDKYGIAVMIDLLDTEIFNSKYEETDTEKDYVKSQVNDIKDSAKENNTNFDDLLAYYGFKSEKELKSYLTLNYRRELAIDEYVESKIKDKEVEDYYKENIYGDIKVKHILVSVDVTDDMTSEQQEEAKNAAKKKAEKIIKKLQSGESFTKLARKYSDDTSNAKSGGSLGWISKGDMELDEFDDAAFALKKGKYTTKAVKTSKGYHIIYKADEKDKPKLEEVKDSIIETLVDKKLEEDATLSITALDSVRKDAGLKFKDKDLKKAYNKYIADSKAQAKSQAEQQNS